MRECPRARVCMRVSTYRACVPLVPVRARHLCACNCLMLMGAGRSIELDATGLYITDLGSAHGTIKNGEKIPGNPGLSTHAR